MNQINVESVVLSKQKMGRDFRRQILKGNNLGVV